ncbi:MAG: glycine reductase [Deltaproteobacteria bacterium]|nr:glycine reductase [Deltaproteobacteria bacterium]
MVLDLESVEVSEVAWGDRTALEESTLRVNPEELRAIAREEPTIGDLRVELVNPGESARIVHILDIVEPRVKPDTGTFFPGLLGDLKPCGEGRTRVLRGVGVTLTGRVPGSEEGLLDMLGPGAELSPFARLHHLVLVPEPADGTVSLAYGYAIMRTALRVAVHLARAALDAPAQQVERRILEAVGGGRRPAGGRGLPRVGYLFHLYSHGDFRDMFFYGQPTRELMPTVLHPNEVFDGAIVSAGYTRPGKHPTHETLNHPVLTELMARDGKELEFLGAVLTNHHAGFAQKERSAVMAARVLRALGAEGVVITKDGGGQADTDLMLACERCEEAGIRTVVMAMELGGREGNAEVALADSSPKADLIVSTGNASEYVDLPRVDRVVGGSEVADWEGPADGPITTPLVRVVGGVSLLGSTRLGAIDF